MKDSLRFGATKVESFNRLNFKQELTNDPKDYNTLNLPLFLPLNFCSHDEMRKFRTKRSIERSRGASGVRRGFSLSPPRGVDRWEPLSCIPVTPYPVATWVKPRINQVSLSWFTDSGRVDNRSPMGKAHLGFIPLVTWRFVRREESTDRFTI